MAKQTVITAAINGLVLTLDFANNERIRLDASTLTREVFEQAVMHGLKQKLVDAAAMSRNPANGASATVDDKFAAVKAVYERIIAGEWNANREGSGGSGSLLLRALIELYPAKTREELVAWLDGKSAKEQAALRATPKVAAIIERIKAASAKPTDDAADLLADLEG
jgi:hypothetical protein